MTEPARTIAEATVAFDYEHPLPSGDARFVDLEPARGGHASARLRRQLERAEGWTRLALVSHRGAGKSTELLRVTHDTAPDYLSVHFEANVELDASSFSMEDLLLVIARVVEAELREQGLPLDPTVLAAVEGWFAETVLSDEQGRRYLATLRAEAGATAGVPFLARLLTALTMSLKVESSQSQRVRRTLRNFPGTLLEHVNALLDAAHARLGGRKLLLVIDNLDRYRPRVVDELLVQAQDRFKALRCSFIVTPPISLMLRPETQAIDDVLHCEVMPTVRLRRPDQAYDAFDGPGRDLLLDVLRRRVDLDRLMPERRARDLLISASGGAIRELLELAHDVTLRADGATMTADDVMAARRHRQARLRNRVDQSGWWEVLGHLAREHRPGKDEAYRTVLYQRLAFEYNGEIWYDVHPLLGEELRARGLLGPSA